MIILIDSCSSWRRPNDEADSCWLGTEGVDANQTLVPDSPAGLFGGLGRRAPGAQADWSPLQPQRKDWVHWRLPAVKILSPQSVLILALLMLVMVPFCHAEDLRVRLISTKTGQPLKGQPIIVYLGSKGDGPTGPAVHGATGPDGIAVISLPSPSVDKIYVGDASDNLYHCSPYDQSISTRQIFREGVIAPNKCGLSAKLKGKIQARPGEVVLFARPLRWYEQGQW